MHRLGIFGGTFDPPHIGHLILAAEALDQLSLKKILWVLTPYPPHKGDREITPWQQRLSLLQAALAGEPRFEVCRVDIDRQPPHFAADTVALLRQAHPNAQLIYLMGGDSLVDLPAWKRPQDFVTACDEIGVMLRPGKAVDLGALERALPGMADKLRFIHAPLLEISSSKLREKIAQGRAYRYFLPPAVYELIQQQKLYL